jgi:integrase
VFIRGHALRHITISILISEGAPIEIVRSIAGHADAEITRAVYLHLGYKPSVAPMDLLSANLFQKVRRATAESPARPSEILTA